MKRRISDISAGAVIFRRRNNLEFLLLKNRFDEWELAKGHLQDKDIRKSALIEVLEETGFDAVEFIDGFFEKISYVKEFDKEIADKTIYFFLVEKDDEIKLSKEHSEFCWKDLGYSCSLIVFDEQKALLEKATSFINSKLS
ncbi:MAG: NUDIX domain-containing protein [Nanoarchaeota archaeon]|nr:NUDIX domain-containing protein [Nanoarchaeota archaeon]MBU1613571.1 NUDIX domain-containing protein [Patescibacteria group bacterium]MBU1876133.1 NUDIX domain-containing protein [Nanoarchaeota archaeon]